MCPLVWWTHFEELLVQAESLGKMESEKLRLRNINMMTEYNRKLEMRKPIWN